MSEKSWILTVVMAICFGLNDARIEAFDGESFDLSAVESAEAAEEYDFLPMVPDGCYESFFVQPFLIRGQQSDGGYWGTVQQQYSPYFLAQNSEPASIAPTLTPSTAAPSPAAGSIAPPLIDVNSTTLAPEPVQPAPEGQTFFNEPVGTMKRFWDSFSLNYTYVPRGSADRGLGINDFDFSCRFALPCKHIPHANDTATTGYWYIMPTFGLTLWDGPYGWPANAHSMPGSTFDAALAARVIPQFTKDFGMDLWVQVGMAASFKKVNKDAIFIRGRALGTLRINEQIDAIGGVVYYDRNRFKLLPSGGINWRPNEKNIWYLVFPNPKLSRFLRKVNNVDWWAYVRGDIGGGRWLIKDGSETFNVDYNDYGVGLGVTFSTPSGFDGSLEVGGEFGRELYSQGHAWYTPKSMVYLKGALAY